MCFSARLSLGARNVVLYGKARKPRAFRTSARSCASESAVVTRGTTSIDNALSRAFSPPCVFNPLERCASCIAVARVPNSSRRSMGDATRYDTPGGRRATSNDRSKVEGWVEETNSSDPASMSEMRPESSAAWVNPLGLYFKYPRAVKSV